MLTTSSNAGVCYLIGHVDRRGLYPFNTRCVRCGEMLPDA